MLAAVRVRIALLMLLVALGAPRIGGTSAGQDPVVPGFFDLRVPGGAETLEALRIGPDEQALTLSILARALYGQGNSAQTAARARGILAATRQVALTGFSAPSAENDLTVPAPLSDAFWRGVLKLPRSADLFCALTGDRGALLMAAGATSADQSIREWLADDREMSEWILRHAPATFAIAARSLRLDKRQIAVPGGEGANALWEALTGVSPARPTAFLRALLSRDGGRLAWFFDTLASLTPDRLAWVLEAGNSTERIEQARLLYDSFRDADGSWRLEDYPFQRNAADPQTVLQLVGFHEGRMVGPRWRWFWDALFSRDSIRAREARSIAAFDRADVQLSWLTRQIATSRFRERRTRLEVLRLAQRVARDTTPESAPDLLVALSGHGRFPALLLTLERIGVTTPAACAAITEAAYRVDEGGESDRRAAIATFQGALAIVERARLVRMLEAAGAERLVESLARAVNTERAVTASVATWIVDSLIPALPPLEIPDAWTGKTAYESTILQAMSGLPGRDRAHVTWEGLEHTLDLAATERERLSRLRATVPSPGLDAALSSRRPDLLAAALIALAYTPALGDPDGSALLSPDVVSRHDFGESAVGAERRAFGPWQPPRDMLGIDGPWRVEGSLLGLDIALARLVMRRMADEEMPRAPTINLNDWHTLTRSVTTLDPYELTDGDRGLLAAAIARGRERVDSAAGNLDAILSLAREARVSATVQELLPWIVSRQPHAVSGFFALRDLLWLGQPAMSAERLDRWGVPAQPLDGRLIPAMPRPAPWEDHAGYADDGRISTQLPDLTLRLVEDTARLQLPARLVPALLSFAVQDFGHDVDARFADDWPAMARAAQSLSQTRIEDYVAALAGTGHLR
jgi:hypothetical protein